MAITTIGTHVPGPLVNITSGFEVQINQKVDQATIGILTMDFQNGSPTFRILATCFTSQLRSPIRETDVVSDSATTHVIRMYLNLFPNDLIKANISDECPPDPKTTITEYLSPVCGLANLFTHLSTHHTLNHAATTTSTHTMLIVDIQYNE